jgi:arsenic resistance protein ArsH
MQSKTGSIAFELTTALNMAENNLGVTNERIKVLVLYGNLPKRSYSKMIIVAAKGL